MAEKILIVDDTTSNTSILQEILESRGYIVCAAPDGVVALNVVSRMQPDLIVLDVWMPELNGLETCRRLKANPATAEIPILFASEEGDGASILQGFRAGGADYIVRPFKREEVLAQVEAHLRIAMFARALQAKNTQLRQANEQLERDIAHRQYTKEILASAAGRPPAAADQEALAEHFLRVFAADAGIKTPRQAATAIKALMAQVFATTVRELKNQMKQTVGEPAGASKAPKPGALFPNAATPMEDAITMRSQAEPQMNDFTMDQCPLNLERAESLLIQRALAQTGGNVAKAARLLGINRTRIYRRLRQPGAVAGGDAHI